jgi:hypothetical protein
VTRDKNEIRFFVCLFTENNLIGNKPYVLPMYPALPFLRLRNMIFWCGNMIAQPKIQSGINFSSSYFVFSWLDSASGPRPSLWDSFITLRHTIIVRTTLDEWSASPTDLYLTSHTTHKRELSMSPAGIEPAIPASERPQTQTLESSTTGIGILEYYPVSNSS